ncbi:MAG: HRDC domain-containing protein [Planctomycetes bacterium]|nr:HRDC domain-containing protein [Planctomycetota bacterium]
MATPELVTEQGRLDTLCRRWRRAGRIAFDTEFIRDDTYDAALCLIQVTLNDDVVLIDPTADLDIAPFWELVTTEAVRTIVHAGKEDFEVCLRTTGRPPRNVFDVQIAAGFVGLGYPLSLARLVGAASRHRIAKGQTLTDWLRRPLTDEQVRYAVEDVKYLPEIHDLLEKRLAETGRTAWAREEFTRFEDPLTYQRPVQLRLFKLKGTKKLDGLELMVLERLMEWRKHWAQARNRPTRAMMRDDVLVTLAKRRPKRPSELEVLRGFPQSRKSKVVHEILEVIKQAAATPRAEWPEPYKLRDESPMTKVVLSILSAYVRAVCHEEDLGHDLVGSTQRLGELLDYLLGDSKERPLLLSGWREEFIGRRLVDLLEGRSELHLSGWPHDLRLQVVSHPAEDKPRQA